MSMCIDPSIFGPHYWTVIHLTCFNSGNKPDDIAKFIDTLPAILPCIDCSDHLKENLKMLPFNKEDPFRWSVDLHNLVNSQLGKPTFDYETARQFWQDKCDGKQPRDYKLMIIIVLIVLFVVGMAFR